MSFKLYKSYSFKDKDPIIDRVRTIYDDGDNTYAKVSEASGVSPTTLFNWFEGPTRRPQYATIAAVVSALGYQMIISRKIGGKVVQLRRRRVG